MHPVVALLTAGVEMDVLGIGYSGFQENEREAVVCAYPRTAHFKEDIEAFYNRFKHKPDTTLGAVNADVLRIKIPTFKGEISVLRSVAQPGAAKPTALA
jgi:hypothetical protein